MATIRQATIADAALLSRLAGRTFVESHGHSASAADIADYVTQKYTAGVLAAELADPRNIYHLIYHENQPAGFSKIRFDEPCPERDDPHLTKLERLYLLRDYYETGLGRELFAHAVSLSRQHGQRGMWLYVWQQNERALRFYTRQGFQRIGEFDFPISASHSNPNYRLLLLY